MSEKEKILEKLRQAVIIGETEECVRLAQEAIDAGIEPMKTITEGLSKGMEVVGDKFENKEYFLPEMLLAGEAMYAALELLLPLLKTDKSEVKEKVLLGVVEGDIHDIGKNIVKAMLTAAGYEVIDLGVDVPASEFVKKAAEEDVGVIAMSTMMTPTLMSMKDVEDQLAKKGLKGKVKTIIGGGTVTEQWKSKMGSDAFGKDAGEAVDKVKLLIQEIKAAVKLMEKKRKK
ncbi:MAG: corrinoid protein [Candidatus Bathyarchaeota archaeon]|jgi:corrinoid protein of di/trimethylamine methyltransferase